MSTIVVRQDHAHTPADAKTRLGDFEQTLSRWGVKLAWRGDKAEIKGVGVSGEVVVASDSVSVTVKLGLLAKAAGIDPERLKRRIERDLDAALG